MVGKFIFAFCICIYVFSKHQRWLNDVFLLGGFDNERLIDRDWNIIEMPRKPTVFSTVRSEIFSPNSKVSAQDDLLSERLLHNEVMALQMALEKRAPRRPQSAPSSFGKLDRRLRKLLDKFQGTDELCQLDDMICSFLAQTENSKRVLHIDDGFLRIVSELVYLILTK